MFVHSCKILVTGHTIILRAATVSITTVGRRANAAVPQRPQHVQLQYTVCDGSNVLTQYCRQPLQTQSSSSAIPNIILTVPTADGTLPPQDLQTNSALMLADISTVGESSATSGCVHSRYTGLPTRPRSERTQPITVDNRTSRSVVRGCPTNGGLVHNKFSLANTAQTVATIAPHILFKFRKYSPIDALPVRVNV
jgi:hypothetical protein